MRLLQEDGRRAPCEGWWRAPLCRRCAVVIGQTARQLLAAAHARMTPAEIAAHALDLADELERMHRAIDSVYAAMNAASDSVICLQDALTSQQQVICRIRELFEGRRKREARDLLSTAAAMPVPKRTTVVKLESAWSTRFFDPYPERKAK